MLTEADSDGFGIIPPVESQNWQADNGLARGLGATIASGGSRGVA